MSKMLPCPICGKEVNADSAFFGVHYNDIMHSWVFDHWCDEDYPTACWISVRGKTKEEVIERWNHRAEVKTSESL